VHGLGQLRICLKRVRSFITLIGLDEWVKAAGRFLVGGNHYGWNVFLMIQGVDQGTKVAADDYQIRPRPVQSHVIGKNFFLAKRDQVNSEIQLFTESLDFLEIQATVQNEYIRFCTQLRAFSSEGYGHSSKSLTKVI
jgi:hypothetical protein